MLFSELIQEVKTRATLDQGGSTFDTVIKNSINTSILRIARESPWKSLRRRTTFSTDEDYTTGTGAVTVTADSKNVSVTGASFITAGIKIGRRVMLGGSSMPYKVATITGATTFTVDVAYDGTTSSTQSYKIYGTEEYNLPIQTGKIGFIWHEKFGYPYVLDYVTDIDFFHSSTSLQQSNIPTHYRMWGENTIITQPLIASVMSVFSSSTSDTSKNITFFGTVSGYPDYEIITANGTTTVSGTKSFSSIERISKDSSTAGRITISDSSSTILAVLPVGMTTSTIQYKKIQLYPQPQTIFPINVQYYKEPYSLVNNGDTHDLGNDFDESIILLACSKIKFGTNQKEGEYFYKLFLDEMKTLRRVNLDRNLDWLPRLQRPSDSYMAREARLHRNLSYNQLGGFYGPRSF